MGNERRNVNENPYGISKEAVLISLNVITNCALGLRSEKYPTLNSYWRIVMHGCGNFLPIVVITIIAERISVRQVILQCGNQI